MPYVIIIVTELLTVSGWEMNHCLYAYLLAQYIYFFNTFTIYDIWNKMGLINKFCVWEVLSLGKKATEFYDAR